MNIDPNALLRALGSGARPASADGPALTLNGATFQQMLEQANGVSSGLPIRIARGAGVDLSASQLARLSSAADRAEAAGASQALVTIDGMVLRMDVSQRTITGKADMSATRVLNGVDAVVTVAADAGEVPGAPLPVQAGSMNASLLKILENAMPAKAAAR